MVQATNSCLSNSTRQRYYSSHDSRVWGRRFAPASNNHGYVHKWDRSRYGRTALRFEPCAPERDLARFNAKIRFRYREKKLVNVRLNTQILRMCFFGTLVASTAIAQSNNYRQVNLVSGIPGLGLNLDPALVRPWGIALSPGQPFRVANNKTGNFRSYDVTGRNLPFEGNVALPTGGTARSKPSAVAANSTGLFAPHGSLASPFIFATEDGTTPLQPASTL
jgi:hypothetical protein